MIYTWPDGKVLVHRTEEKGNPQKDVAGFVTVFYPDKQWFSYDKNGYTYDADFIIDL